MSDRLGVSAPPDDTSAADVYARVTDGVFALDEDWRFTFLDEEAQRLLACDEDDLLGEVVWDAFPEAMGSTFQQEYERAMETQEPVTFEEYYPPLATWFEVRAFPSESGLTAYFRDITERKERERELRERERALRRAYEVVADSERSFHDQVAALLAVVRETLGTDYATLSHVHDDEYVFETVDAPADADLQQGESVPLETTNCERVVATERTLVLEDVEADAPDLADRSGNAEWGISCYLGAPVTVDGEVYGTFCFYDMEARSEEFSDWEVTFVDLLSNWVSHELERRRYVDRLAALNELDGVVRGITDAAIGKSTREEIEAIACRRLAEADSYSGAWIGEADPATQEVRVRAEAGLPDDPGEVAGSLDPDAAGTPPADALRTGEMRVDRDVSAGATGDGVVAAVPVSHDGSVYGVLAVYSGRADAFEDEEAAVIEHLGGILGHAIAAVERKRALTSDAVVELTFRVRNVLDEEVPPPADGPVVFEEVVPVGDGEFLVYGSAPEEGLSALTGSDSYDPYLEGTTRIERGDDGVSFELRLSEPPVLSTVASLGAAIDNVVVGGGDFRVTVQLPPDADVRRVFDSVREVSSDAEVISKRRVTRQAAPAERVGQALADELTDRQLTTLRAAHSAGFFEWPRVRSGEEVAESLDITSATFHQHLRAAENKLFDALFGDSPDH